MTPSWRPMTRCETSTRTSTSRRTRTRARPHPLPTTRPTRPAPSAPRAPPGSGGAGHLAAPFSAGYLTAVGIVGIALEETGAGPQVMAALRNTAINISRLAGHTYIAAAQRIYSWTPTAALDAVLDA